MTAFTRLCTDGSKPIPSLRKIEWITFSTERSARKSCLGDRGVVLALGHLAQHVAFARRQLVERGCLGARLGGNEALDDLGIDDRASRRHLPDRADELAEVVDALLEQVATSCGAALEQRERVARLGVLAEDDDPDLRMRLPEPSRCLDALVDAARGHADVGDDDVRSLRLDGGEQRVQVLADRDDLDLGLGLEQPPHALADEIVIICEHDANRHAVAIG